MFSISPLSLVLSCRLVLFFTSAFSLTISDAHIKPSGLNPTQPWRPRSLVLWALTTELLELLSTSSSQPGDLRPGRGPTLFAGPLPKSQLPELLPSPPVRWQHPPPPAAKSLPPAQADALPALLPSTLAPDHRHVLAATSADCRAFPGMAMALLPSAPAPTCAVEQSEKSVSRIGLPATSPSSLNLFVHVAARLAFLVRSRRKTRTGIRTCYLWCRRRSSTNCGRAGRARTRDALLRRSYVLALRPHALKQPAWSPPRRA